MADPRIVLSAVDRTKAAFESAKQGLLGLENRATAANAGLGKLGAFLGAGFAAGTFTAFIRETVAGIDRLNDLKDATGSSIENLSALEDVALRTGTSFEAVGASIVKFNQALSNAKAGSETAEVLKAIGLSAAELKKLDPAEALRRTAVALQGFADDGNKARAVQELFGRSVREVAPFLNDLAKQSQLVAKVTTEEAEAAERFNQSLSSLQKNSIDFARVLVGPVVSAINETLESMKALGGFTGAIASRLGIDEQGKLTRQAADISAAIDRATGSIERMQEELNRRGGNDDFLAMRIEKARERLQKLSKDATDVSQKLQVLAGNLAPSSDTSHDRLEARRLEAFRRTIGGIPDPKKARQRSVEDILRNEGFNFRRSELTSTDEVNAALRVDQLKDYNDERERFNRIMASTPTARATAIRREIELLNKNFPEGERTSAQYVLALMALEKELEDLGPASEKANEALSTFSDEARRNIQDAFGETIVRTAKGDFDSIAELWGDLLLRMAAEAAAAELGKTLLGTGKDGDNGALGALFSAFMNAWGGGSVPSYDVGTPFVPRDQLAMVHKGERIIPADQNKQGLGGVTYDQRQTFNVAAGVSRAELISALQVMRDSLRSEFRTTLQRTGAI